MNGANQRLAENLRDMGYNAVLLDEAEPTDVDWIWPGRIPCGKLTDLSGDAGNLKSTLTLGVGARVTTGAPMPDETESDLDGPRSVLVLSDEDGFRDTVIPRIVALGGDRERIIALSEHRHEGTVRLIDITKPADRDNLLHVCKNMDPPVGLIILDPIKAFLGSANTNRETEVRTALAPLLSIAEELNVGVIMIRHLNKDADLKNPLYRSSGSMGFVNKARSVLMVGKDPDDHSDERRILTPVKTNISKPPESLAYRPAETEEGFLGIEWEGETAAKAADILSNGAGSGESKREIAREFLKDELTSEPRPASEFLDAGEMLGIPTRTIQRARKDIGGESTQDHDLDMDGYAWYLPEDKT